MAVHYKFKSTFEVNRVLFDGPNISVADLKKAIFQQKRLGKKMDMDLRITNAETKEEYTEDNALIAKNTSVIVVRVPLTQQQKRTLQRTKSATANKSIVDLTKLDMSEADKIRAMMGQSAEEYDASKYMRMRGSRQSGKVPGNYRCYKCHQPGHWIKDCPLGDSKEPVRIKKSTGIPKSFMVTVEGPSVPGAMLTSDGTYAVPVISKQAYKEPKKEKHWFDKTPEPVVEKPVTPADLLCNICKDLLAEAVQLSCCGTNVCSVCIQEFLLESEERCCPNCKKEDTSPDSLIPNSPVRRAVQNFEKWSSLAKRLGVSLSERSWTVEPIVSTESVEPPVSEKSTVSLRTSPAKPTQATEPFDTASAAPRIVQAEPQASVTYEKASLRPISQSSFGPVNERSNSLSTEQWNYHQYHAYRRPEERLPGTNDGWTGNFQDRRRNITVHRRRHSSRRWRGTSDLRSVYSHNA